MVRAHKALAAYDEARCAPRPAPLALPDGRNLSLTSGRSRPVPSAPLETFETPDRPVHQTPLSDLERKKKST